MEHCVARRSRRHKDRQYIQRVTIGIGDRQVDDPFEAVVGPISCKESKQSRKSRHQPRDSSSDSNGNSSGITRADGVGVAVDQQLGSRRADGGDHVLNGADSWNGRVVQVRQIVFQSKFPAYLASLPQKSAFRK